MNGGGVLGRTGLCGVLWCLWGARRDWEALKGGWGGTGLYWDVLGPVGFFGGLVANCGVLGGIGKH